MRIDFQSGYTLDIVDAGDTVLRLSQYKDLVDGSEFGMYGITERESSTALMQTSVSSRLRFRFPYVEEDRLYRINDDWLRIDPDAEWRRMHDVSRSVYVSLSFSHNSVDASVAARFGVPGGGGLVKEVRSMCPQHSSVDLTRANIVLAGFALTDESWVPQIAVRCAFCGATAIDPSPYWLVHWFVSHGEPENAERLTMIIDDPKAAFSF